MQHLWAIGVGIDADRPPTGLRQGEGAGGAAHLIGHHLQGLSRLGFGGVEPQHRAAEVFAHRAIHPTGAQQPRLWVLQGGLLTARLTGAIDPQGVAGLLGPIGMALGAVEHKVGADLQQAAAGLLQCSSESRWSLGIHRLSQRRLLFGLIHRGVGPGIEHPLRALLFHDAAAGR